MEPIERFEEVNIQAKGLEERRENVEDVNEAAG